MKNIKVLSLFSGIGAFEKALKNIGVDFELVGYSEISKSASKAYASIHGISENLNYGDIKNINENKLPHFDLMTWGFPCVGFSIARRDKENKRTGLNNDDSGLYYEGLRILEANKPMISIIENVHDLMMSDKFKDQYESIMEDLNSCGYISKTAVLSGPDFNIPQNRKRLFIISIRKDIYRGFEFPEPIGLTRKAKDLLDNIDEIEENFLKVNPSIIDKVKTRRVRDVNICQTITKAIGRGGSSSEYISSCAFIYRNTGVLRRMTPKETMLFTGFTKEDYEKAKAVSSNSKIFDFSGNSICVPVLEHLFKSLLIDFKYEEVILNNKNLKDKDKVQRWVYKQLEFNIG